MVNIITVNTLKGGKLTIISKENIKNSDLVIISNEESFNCKISDDGINTFAQEYEISVDEYLETINKLLSVQSEETCVQIKQNTFNLYKTHNSKAVFFSAPITKVNHCEAQQKSLQLLLQRHELHRKTIEDLNTEKQVLQAEIDELKDKMLTSAAFHQERNDATLSCFLRLLNEKKRYIQFLKNKLTDDEQKDLEESYKKQKLKRKLPNNELSDSASSEEEENSYETSMEGSLSGAESNKETAAEESNALDDILGSSDDEQNAIQLPKRTYTSQETKTVAITAGNSQATASNHSKNNHSLADEVEESPVSLSSGKDTNATTFHTQDLLDEL